jgi:hypothetical protein
MSMNIVGLRFTPPTTQVKANNEQRSGSGLSEVEQQAILRRLHELSEQIKTSGAQFIRRYLDDRVVSMESEGEAATREEFEALREQFPDLYDRYRREKSSVSFGG